MLFYLGIFPRNSVTYVTSVTHSRLIVSVTYSHGASLHTIRVALGRAHHSSVMDEYRDLGMCKYLDRLAAEDDCRDATATVRGHDDKITAF